MESSRRRGHRQLDHTADLALELWAPTEPELLDEGARAIVELLTGGRGSDEMPARVATRAIHIAAIDAGDRLVQWLNEVLVAAIADGFLFAGADLTLSGGDGGERRLDAVMRGRPDAGRLVVTELKSVTYHDLEVAGDARGWHARIVIDV